MTVSPALIGTLAGATASVNIMNFAFMPASVPINAGDTVTWTNHDQAAHSVVFLSGGPQTQVLANGQSASIPFANAGTFSYICGIHGTAMMGTVIVRAVATPQRTVAPTPVPTVRQTVAPTVEPTMEATATATATASPTASPPPTTAAPSAAGVAAGAPSPPGAAPAASSDGGPSPFLIAGAAVVLLALAAAAFTRIRR